MKIDNHIIKDNINRVITNDVSKNFR